MALCASVVSKTFIFHFQARTSRGAMKDRPSLFIKLWNDRQPEVYGLGECAPLEGLSPETFAEAESTLRSIADQINSSGYSAPEVNHINQFMSLRPHQGFSSVVFALETALRDLAYGGRRVVFDNAFVRGAVIPINGLIWMGGMDFMLQQIEIKVREGFRCLKIKVGGIDFEKECDTLQYVRRKYYREDITLRLDANGAFKADDAPYKLKELSRFAIHSIEQPLKPGHPALPTLCSTSPIPIALDEELIGVATTAEKEELLNRINPSFLILKPTLHGGLSSVGEWVRMAEQRGIGWWITSALESNIGLNAIAQLTCQLGATLPQGLGTGQLYTNNIESPLRVEAGLLRYDTGAAWRLIDFHPDE
jgi:o-succinylbenzoate synthase